MYDTKTKTTMGDVFYPVASGIGCILLYSRIVQTR